MMSTQSSPPLLLIFNTDTCSHCRVFLSKRDETNRAIKEKYPEMRYIWITLDNMNLSVLSPSLKDQLKFFPFVIYYARGEWEQMSETNMTGTVMKLEEIQPSVSWGPEKILNWLETVVDPIEKCDEWAEGPQIHSLPGSSSSIDNSIVSLGPKGSPVLVMYMSDNCRHCSKLMEKKSTGMNMLAEICSEIRDNFNVRFCSINVPDMFSKLDSRYPSDLGFYQKWYPGFVLVPGPVFDRAMENPNLKIREGVQIMNGKWDSHQRQSYSWNQTIKPVTVSDYMDWFGESISAPDFVEAQSSKSRSPYATLEDAVYQQLREKGHSVQRDEIKLTDESIDQAMKKVFDSTSPKLEDDKSLTYTLNWKGNTYTMSYDFHDNLSLKVAYPSVGSVGLDLNILSIVRAFMK